MATKRIISLATAAALKSKFQWRVGAVVYSGSKIYGVGTNDMLKTSPHSFHPYKSRHAEFNALTRVPKSKWKGASLYVHRIGMDGMIHMAKPCEACDRMLTWAEIKDVEWSVDPI